ncbi:U-box domain-containing protein 4 [Platanthera guangdongensis]|uniref:RING-type E3 ubiquitin transferase n=1 Tax=Platanthera guangdongensis TaxID=2320717 RepID=A0ABR2MZM5_9ASPA
MRAEQNPGGGEIGEGSREADGGDTVSDMDEGPMELSSIKALLDSIFSFGLLASDGTIVAELVHRYRQTINEILVLLNPVLEESILYEIVPSDKLNEALVELDAVVNEARELLGSWHQMMSKIYFVLQNEPLIRKIQTIAVATCQLLISLHTSTVCSENVESLMKKIQQMRYEKLTDSIKVAIEDQMNKRVPRSDYLERISNLLSLSSNQELLMEVVALDKLKSKVGHSDSQTDLEHIDHIIALITYMHDRLVKVKQLHSINGIPIPPDFCCPLSLELMSDPVIVASGQTYERAFIKKWLDQGFKVCPKTRQTLGHSNLIPNYTVKALIENWCESNNIKLPDPVRSMNQNLPSAFIGPIDMRANDGKISPPPSGSHPERSKYTRSPENNVPKGLISSNGIHRESSGLDNPSSQHHSSKHSRSTALSFRDTDECDGDFARMSLSSPEDRSESRSDQRYSSAGGQGPTHSKQDFSQDNQLQRRNHRSSASTTVLNNEHHKEVGDERMVSRVDSDFTQTSSDASGEVMQETPNSSTHVEPEFVSRFTDVRSRSQNFWRRPSDRFAPKIIPSPSLDNRPDLSGVETQVRKLVEDLRSDAVDMQRAATEELRLLAKHNMENRIVIANCGAIPVLVGLLHSTDPKTQENAVTALLNLSINDNNKAAIANAEAIDPLIYVLETGNSEAKENSAATLFSLSVIEENKVRIGRSGAINPLVELLGNGTRRGKKDAATALFNLSIFHENKARIVQAGAVRHLVELMDPAAGMVDKAVAVLANLATIPEGRTAIGHEGGIPVLVEVVELGSARGKENAAAALLQLCTNSNRFCSLVLQEGAVPPLVALSQSGTPRAKEKAQALLSYFRNQRHGNAGRA